LLPTIKALQQARLAQLSSINLAQLFSFIYLNKISQRGTF
jgi:hypothetical protein